jgi:regulator of replication initiation timing
MYNWFNYSRLKKQLESQLAENAALREENKNLEDILKSIEEDGTEEHNNAIKLRQENFCLKNDYTVLKARHQIVQNDYKKCTEQRDEFKHQLNAANKEIEVLKSKLKT